MSVIVQRSSAGNGDRTLPLPPATGATLVVVIASRGGVVPPVDWTIDGSQFGGRLVTLSKVADPGEQATTFLGLNDYAVLYELSIGAAYVGSTLDDDAVVGEVVNSVATTASATAGADEVGLFVLGNTAAGVLDSGIGGLGWHWTASGFSPDGVGHAFDGWPGSLIAHFEPGTYTPTATWEGNTTSDGYHWYSMFARYTGLPAPVTPPPIVDVYDPDDVHLATLTGAFDVKFRPALDDVGSGEFKINRHDPDATSDIIKPENYVRITVPQVDATRPMFGFFLEAGDFTLVSTDEEGGEVLQFSGRGGLAYWDRAIWLSESFLVQWWTGATAPAAGDIGQITFRAGTYHRYTVSGGHASSPISFTTGGFTAFYDTRRLYTRTGLGPITLIHIRSGSHAGWYVHPFGPGVTDRKKVAHYRFGPSVLMSSLSTNKTPGEVIWAMYQEAIAADRPIHPLPLMTIDFTDTTDSDGDPWTVIDALDAISAQVGDDYLSTIGQLIQTGALDVDMDPNLGMHVYNSYGRDLHATSFATDKVIFRRAFNIADQLGRVLDDPPVGTFAEVLGNEETSVARVTLAVDRPPREISVHGDSDDIDALASLGEAQLEQRLLHSDTVAFRVNTPIIGREDELNGLYLPGRPGMDRANYWLGDIVTLDTGTGVHDFDNETVRIWAITFEWDAGSNMKITVEVGSGFGGLPAMGSGTHDTTGGVGGTNVSTLSDDFQQLSEKDEPTGYAGLDAEGHLFPEEMSSLNWKNSVRAIDVAGGTLATDFAAGAVIDGVTLAEGDDIALAGQTAASENGVRIVQATGAPTRRPDLDSTEEFVGSAFMVREGDAYAATIWRVENSTPPVVDTDDIVLSNIFSVAGLIALNNAVFGYLDHGNVGATETFDASAAGWHKGTLDANDAATFIGATVDSVASMVIELVQDGTGGRTIDFPAAVTNGSSLEASLDPTAGATTYYVFFSHDGGTNWIGFVMGGGVGTGATSTSTWKPVMAGEPAIVTSGGEAVWIPLVSTDGEAIMIFAPL